MAYTTADGAITTLADVLTAAVTAHEHVSTECWWRGHSDHTWQLRPGLFRKDRGDLFEHNATNRFRRAAHTRHPKCPPADDLSAWLFLMQHYRLPTRLLDWTESVLVALYFAVTGSPGVDGALWAMAPHALNQVHVGEPVLLNPADPRPKKLISQAFSPDKAPGNQILAVLPDEIDVRIAAQFSVFTLHGSETPLETFRDTGKPLLKIPVPASRKAGLEEALHTIGIRRSNLFPDLENLAAEISTMEFRSGPTS